MSLTQLRKVDTRTKDTVKGWIRNEQKILQSPNVPHLIKAICILYYREFDLFDEESINENLVLDDECKTVSTVEDIDEWCLDNEDYIAFGKVIAIKDRVYHWRVKVESNYGSFRTINIGIINQEAIGNMYSGGEWYHENYGYSYHQDGVTCNGEQTDDIKYGTAFQAGDIIDVWLDLKDKMSLSYCKNGTNYGKAFDINGYNNKRYKFAVSMDYGKITIEKFEVFYT